VIEKLKRVLAEENPRQPYTDESLAERLGIRRERVIELRSALGIPDSRERLKAQMIADCIPLLREDEAQSVRSLTAALQKMGYTASRYLVKAVRDEIVEGALNAGEEKSRPISEKAASKTACFNEGFDSIIGRDEGLLTQVNQAKAAMAYPSGGLSTLIIGPSGTGKTYLAEAMYRFGIRNNILQADAPFIVFNCADYADNPQLLMSQLFGHVKGAFSGATEDKKGLVETADGGILFLDEVHRLPNEGQELLFYLLDKGEFRRLGDSGAVRRVSVRVIAATTKPPESSLLLTFRRRIPMVITIPALSDRPLKERYRFLKHFFYEEMRKLNRKIIVKAESVKILLTYQCPGNVGQLKSDVQVACAEGFLASMVQQRDVVYITPDLFEKMKPDMNRMSSDAGHLRNYIRDLVFDPEKSQGTVGDALRESAEETPGELAPTIYQVIQTALDETVQLGVDDEVRMKAIKSQIDAHLRELQTRYGDEPNPSMENVWDSIVDAQTIAAVDHALAFIRPQFPRLDTGIRSILAVHLDAVVKSLAVGSYIRNTDLSQSAKNFPSEYAAAVLMLKQISMELNLEIPGEEAAIVAMYLKAYSSGKTGGRIRVIVLTHGQVGKAMADVANRMLDVNNAVGISMDLSESVDSAFERVCNVVVNIDEGQGCILLVDMGSLVSFGQKITERTGIKVRCVARVDTLMVLDALRRANLGEDYSVDVLAQALESGRLYGINTRESDSTGKPPVLITLCITGEGNARNIREVLETSFPGVKGNIEMIELGLFDRGRFTDRIAEIQKTRDIMAIIGTINPDLPGIPFFSLDYVMTGHGTLALSNLLSQRTQLRCRLSDLVTPETVLFHPQVMSKNEVIDQLTAKLVESGHVSEGFLLSVYKRENLGDTCLDVGIAIPHGDNSEVIKPGIAVAKLEHPIYWSAGLVADCVFLFAIDEHCGNYIEIFYQKIRDEQWVERIKNAESKSDVLKLLQ
jgi:transcriptional regulator with AAA-type ATPase domain/transcriptional regulatory protein LevR